MAAQLINNLSAPKQSRPTDQDELKALMAEISDAENNGIQFEALSAQLDHKHKLIYVFARLVLEKLSGDDPFMDTQKLADQASAAIDLYITIAKEVPEVFEYVLAPGATLQGRGQEVLWIWLFPRILTLLGRRNCETLTEKIKDFFYVSFQAVAQSPKLWNLTSCFFCYLKDCTNSMCYPIRVLRLSTNSSRAMLACLQNLTGIHTLPITLPIDSVDIAILCGKDEG